MSVSIRFFRKPESKKIFSGVLPRQTETMEKPNILDFYLFMIEHLPLLYDHLETIHSRREYYFAPLPEAWLSSAYLGRARPEFVLGELLDLWRCGAWVTECARCGSRVYLTNAGGSPLSGRGGAWGVCSGCRDFVSNIRPFTTYFLSALKLPCHPLPDGMIPLTLAEIVNQFECKVKR